MTIYLPSTLQGRYFITIFLSAADQKPSIDKRNFDYPKPPADEPEASKSRTLRNWIEDALLRSPSAILVPLRPHALSRALAVWNDVVSDGGLNVSDIVIVGYDSNGE